jgi:hypothetical protein
MLMQSEHSMAREDRDGSATEMGYMAFVSFAEELFNLCTRQIPRELSSRGHHDWPVKLMIRELNNLVGLPERSRLS